MEKPETWPKERGKYYLVALKDEYNTNVWATYFDGNFRDIENEERFPSEKYITHWVVFPKYPSANSDTKEIPAEKVYIVGICNDVNSEGVSYVEDLVAIKADSEDSAKEIYNKNYNKSGGYYKAYIYAHTDVCSGELYIEDIVLDSIYVSLDQCLSQFCKSKLYSGVMYGFKRNNFFLH